MFFLSQKKGKKKIRKSNNKAKNKIKTNWKKKKENQTKEKLTQNKTKYTTHTHTHKDGVHFVLVYYSRAWGLCWSVVWLIGPVTLLALQETDNSSPHQVSTANSFLVRGGTKSTRVLRPDHHHHHHQA